MTDDILSASKQGPDGPVFAARFIVNDDFPEGAWFVAGAAPHASVINNDSGSLSAGTATIPPRPNAVYRYVQNADQSPMTLQLGAEGPIYVLGSAGFGGAPGGSWPPPGHQIIFTGEIILTGTPTAAFLSGWG